MSRVGILIGPANTEDQLRRGAIEVTAPGLVPHTVLGVSTRRFGVVLSRGSAATRTVTGTLSGINSLPLPMRPMAYIDSDWDMSSGWSEWPLHQ